MTFVGGSQVVGGRDLLSQWESKLLLPFLIVHSHETGREVTNASQVSIPNICYWYKI